MPLPVGPVLVRTEYLYVNEGIEALAILARSEALYENRGVEDHLVKARTESLYENRGIQALAPLERAEYLYEALRDGEVGPWLMRISPTEQYRGGQIDLYGDGFGELLEAAAGATITTSSVNGGNIGTNAVDRAVAEWASNDGGAAWIRFAFAAPKKVVAIALEDRAVAGQDWGVPLFRFSDGGADVVGATTVPKQGGSTSTTEYPVGGVRTLYTLPVPRTTSYVEVRVSSGGAGANRGLGEVWILEDLDQAAEDSEAISNLGLAPESHFGIVLWANRSPGLWPANGGVPITAAATVTVGVTAESGVVVVRESI